MALSFWHGARVGPFRKAAEIPYPYAYASQEQLASASGEKKRAMYLFNCAQRAHANYLENYPSMLAAHLIAGLKYPIAATVAGTLWALFRVMYAVGYTRKDKDEGRGRLVGGGFWLCQLALYGLAATVGVKMLQ
jgi:glutathione S-transferase